MNGQCPSRRGAALLIVLATLILAVTASVTAAKVASTRRLGRELARRTLLADDLAAAAEAPVLAWLSAESSTAVLPLDATAPQLEILNDTWDVNGNRFQLRITAWDQCGMVPIDVTRSGSPVRLTIAPEARRYLDRVELAAGVKPGLDLFLPFVAAGSSVTVFPIAPESEPVTFATGVGPASPGASRADHAVVLDDPQRPAIGSSVATHNPGLINVNTAPIDLVEAAFRAAGRGGLEQIVAARTEGKFTSLAGRPAGSGSQEKAIQLVSSSTRWAFRTDIGIGSLRRSWWALYVKAAGGWECVQRLAIPE